MDYLHLLQKCGLARLPGSEKQKLHLSFDLTFFPIEKMFRLRTMFKHTSFAAYLLKKFLINHPTSSQSFTVVLSITEASTTASRKALCFHHFIRSDTNQTQLMSIISSNRTCPPRCTNVVEMELETNQQCNCNHVTKFQLVIVFTRPTSSSSRLPRRLSC